LQLKNFITGTVKQISVMIVQNSTFTAIIFAPSFCFFCQSKIILQNVTFQ